jgi:adenosine kinase
MLDALPYVDVLFGNESEAAAFAENNEEIGKGKSVKQIAQALAGWKKVNEGKPRMVVITQGADPTIVVANGKVLEFPVIPIKPEDIVDTNGAGDAFVGGFLSKLVLQESLENCIAAGNKLANLVIQKSGASYH